MGHDGRIANHLPIGNVLNKGKLVRADWFMMGKVEAQTVWSDQRSLLSYMFAEHLPQRLMQEMGRRMIGAQCLAAIVVDKELEGKPRTKLAFLDQAFVNIEVAEFFLRIADAKANPLRMHVTRVADLAAGFAIKGRLIEDDGSSLA